MACRFLARFRELVRFWCAVSRIRLGTHSMVPRKRHRHISETLLNCSNICTVKNYKFNARFVVTWHITYVASRNEYHLNLMVNFEEMIMFGLIYRTASIQINLTPFLYLVTFIFAYHQRLLRTTLPRIVCYEFLEEKTTFPLVASAIKPRMDNHSFSIVYFWIYI